MIRGQKVMLDADLAQLYEVPTKVFNQAVKRNMKRFPEGFMFRLSNVEASDLYSNRSQIVTGSQKHRDPRFSPYAFTELGVAMLSSVLSSDRAIEINIAIMKTFVRLREALQADERVKTELRRIETAIVDHDEKINALFLLVDELSQSPVGEEYSSRKIGFIQDDP